jgi:hypothetical protein
VDRFSYNREEETRRKQEEKRIGDWRLEDDSVLRQRRREAKTEEKETKIRVLASLAHVLSVCREVVCIYIYIYNYNI